MSLIAITEVLTAIVRGALPPPWPPPEQQARIADVRDAQTLLRLAGLPWCRHCERPVDTVAARRTWVFGESSIVVVAHCHGRCEERVINLVTAVVRDITGQGTLLDMLREPFFSRADRTL